MEQQQVLHQPQHARFVLRALTVPTLAWRHQAGYVVLALYALLALHQQLQQTASWAFSAPLAIIASQAPLQLWLVLWARGLLQVASGGQLYLIALLALPAFSVRPPL
jgi:hypothetical protein